METHSTCSCYTLQQRIGEMSSRLKALVVSPKTSHTTICHQTENFLLFRRNMPLVVPKPCAVPWPPPADCLWSDHTQQRSLFSFFPFSYALCQQSTKIPKTISHPPTMLGVGGLVPIFPFVVIYERSRGRDEIAANFLYRVRQVKILK